VPKKQPDQLSELEILESGATGWDRFAERDGVDSGARFQPVFDPVTGLMAEGSRRARRLSN
jgi:hypothetical protein